MICQRYSAAGIEVTVEVYEGGSFRLKRGKAASRIYKVGEIGMLQSDGTTFFYGANETTGLSPGVPFIGLPTTVV